jgi:hypothetical protein
MRAVRFATAPIRVLSNAVSKVIEGVKPVRVNSLDGVGDYIHSKDVAHAFIAARSAVAALQRR